MSLRFASADDLTWSSDERIALEHANPRFGAVLADHMAVATWQAGEGWGDDAVVNYHGLDINPGSAVLHYAQEIFEGLKLTATLTVLSGSSALIRAVSVLFGRPSVSPCHAASRRLRYCLYALG